MPRFRASVVRAAPLQIQLTAGEKQLEVLGWYIFAEGASGAISRPVLTRPSKPGVSTGTDRSRIYALDSPGEYATATVLTSFASAPSLPLLETHTVPAPVVYEERWANGVVIEPGETVLLYAATDRSGQSLPALEGEPEKGGLVWTGDIEWREL